MNRYGQTIKPETFVAITNTHTDRSFTPWDIAKAWDAVFNGTVPGFLFRDFMTELGFSEYLVQKDLAKNDPARKSKS